MNKKYYLNNFSKESIQITLSTVRLIKPMSSLSLNMKDVELFKALKAARKGKVSKLDNLRLSTMKIENDCNFDKSAADKAKKADAKARKDAEAKAKEALEKQAAEEAQRKQQRAEIAELLKDEAAKDGKTFDEESLEKAIDEYLKALTEDTAN